MYIYLQQLFDILNRSDNHPIIIAVYLSLILLALLLRIITSTGYRTALFAVRLDAKELRVKEDIKKIRNTHIKKVAAEYIRLCEKSVSRIPTSALAERQVSSLSFMGWRYTAMTALAVSLENGMLFVGIILALVFGDYAFTYGLLAAGGFVVTRLGAAFFDFDAPRKLLADELLIFTEREVGRFFAADSGGAVLRLKDELSSIIGKQTAALTDTVSKLAVSLTDSIDKIGLNLSGAADDRLDAVHATLRQAMRDWETSLSNAGRVQNAVNASAEKIQISSDNLVSASDLLAKHLQGYSGALSDQLSALISAVEVVSNSQDEILALSQFIEKNQKTLDMTLQSYETTLKDMAQQLGDGLGAYLKLHAQSASQSVNDALSDNIEKIIKSNYETTRYIAELFDQLRIQSKDVSAHLYAIHEKLSDLEQASEGVLNG